MDRETYKRWHNHPVRTVLRSAAQHDVKYLPSRSQLVDELTEAGVAAHRHAGILKAAERVAATGTAGGPRARVDAQLMADEVSADIVERMTADDSLLGDGSLPHLAP
jgi:hypothetical protein